MFAGTEQTKTNLKISHKKNNGHLTKKTKKGKSADRFLLSAI